MVRVTQDLPDSCREIELFVRGDERGSLIALESTTGVPFAIQRIYYIYDTRSDVARGFHAHRQLEEWVICVAGACTITVDDGSTRAHIRLNSPDRALEIGRMIWREMSDFTDGAVLLVLADAPYDEGDYIRDYDTFIELVTR